MAALMIVTHTGWDGTDLRLAADEGSLEWTPRTKFRWDVGDVVEPHDTPRYVFEPRPVDRITADLGQATTEAARRMLEAEQRLCDRPHVVYAAFYATLPKVGMTQEARFADRLREQGADAGFVIATTPDRATARDVENAVSFRYDLPQWRTQKEILAQWTRPMDLERIATRADDLRARLAPEYKGGPLQVIDDPHLPVLSTRPQPRPAAGVHEGTVVGAKGNHLVYEADPDPSRLDVGHARLVAVRRSDLEGRAIKVE